MNRGPDRRAIAAATFIAATCSGAPSTALAIVQGDDVLAAAKRIVTMTPIRTDSTVVALGVGGAIHLAISLFWTAVLSRLLPRGHRLLAGTAAGAAIYVLDMEVVARVAHLDALRALPRLGQFGDHLAFGALVGWSLDRTDRRHLAGGDQASGVTTKTG